MAKAKVSLPQPRDCDMGCKNNPKLSRIPIAKARIEVPQTINRSDERLVEFIKPSLVPSPSVNGTVKCDEEQTEENRNPSWHFLKSPLNGLQKHIGKKSKSEAFSSDENQRNNQHRQKGRSGFAELILIDTLDVSQHRTAHYDQSLGHHLLLARLPSFPLSSRVESLPRFGCDHQAEY